MKKQPCRVQNLANNGLCAVDFCPGCNVFHLKIGYATLHVPPDAFLTVCDTVNKALARFQRHRATVDVEYAKSAHEIEGPLH